MAPKGGIPGLAKWLKACFLCGPEQELSEPAYKSYPAGWHHSNLKNGAAIQGYSLSHGQNSHGLESQPLNEQAIYAKGFLDKFDPTKPAICSSDKQVASGESSRTPSGTISLRSSLEAPVRDSEQAHAADHPSSELADVAEPVTTEPARADGHPSSELVDVAAPAAIEPDHADDLPSPELVNTAEPAASEPSGAASPPSTDLADVTAPVASEAVPAGDRSSVKPANAAGPVASEPACASDNPVSDLAQPVPSDLPNAGDQVVPPSTHDTGSGAPVEEPVAGLPMFVRTLEGDVFDITVRPDMKYVTYDDVKYWPARGQGGYSEVTVGCVMRPSWNTGRQKFVSKTMQDKRMLKREIEMMQHLNHPNIIPLEGVVKSSEASQEIVGYLMPNLEGDFLDYLAQLKKQNPDFPGLCVEECMGIALDVLAALCYLHRLNIIYGDLKGANIVRKKVNGEWRWVLIDFGLSIYAGTYTECLAGSPSYVSPEFLRGTVEIPQPITTQSDMYIYGCLMYELYTGHKPWDTREIVDIVNEKYDGNIELPQKPDDVPDFYWDMIVRCLSDDPSMRPTAAQALKEIEEELYRDVE